MRILKSPAFWVILLAFALALATNVSNRFSWLGSNTAQAEDRPSLVKMATGSPLLHEGAIFTEVKGQFRKNIFKVKENEGKTGLEIERYDFVDDENHRSYTCLENICLQRVATAMHGETGAITWVISAKVNEFNDENFLLLDKAVRSRK